MYISNENTYQADVYFDDVTMSYTPTNVVQYNEYYPFGLQTSNSWTRDNVSNNYLYNEGSELNATTGLYDLPFRNYDATLGRFFQVDPLAHTSSDMTSYHYAGNNPVVLNDPSGLMMKSPYTEEQEAESAQNVYKYMSWATDNKHIEAGGGGSSNYYGTSGGGTIELTIGNTTITIDFDEMNGGVYSIGWDDGVITSGAFITDDAEDTDVFFTAITNQKQDGNLILSFIDNTQSEHYKDMNWTNTRVHNIMEAYAAVLTYPGAIKNLVIFSHADGNSQTLILGKDKLSMKDFIEQTRNASNFQNILNNVDDGGNVVIIGCEAGGPLGAAFNTNEINLYMNGDQSHGGWDFNDGYKPYFYMNRPLSDPSVKGWINFSTYDGFTNMIIYSNGGIAPQK